MNNETNTTTAAVRIVRIIVNHDHLANRDELKRIFGQGVEVEEKLVGFVNDLKEAVAQFDQEVIDADVVEVTVMPISLLEAVLKFSSFAKGGGKLIRAVTEQIVHDEGWRFESVFYPLYYEEVQKIKYVARRL